MVNVICLRCSRYGRAGTGSVGSAAGRPSCRRLRREGVVLAGPWDKRLASVGRPPNPSKAAHRPGVGVPSAVDHPLIQTRRSVD